MPVLRRECTRSACDGGGADAKKTSSRSHDVVYKVKVANPTPHMTLNLSSSDQRPVGKGPMTPRHPRPFKLGRRVVGNACHPSNAGDVDACWDSIRYSGWRSIGSDFGI